jgi:ATP-binding cassette subfamily B protein
MTGALETWCWPGLRAGDALRALALRSGLAAQPARLPAPSPTVIESGAEALGEWIEQAAAVLGLEAEPVEGYCTDPVLMMLPGEGEPRFLALLKSGRGGALALRTDLTELWAPAATLRAALRGCRETSLDAELEEWLDAAGLSRRQKQRARGALLRSSLHHGRGGRGLRLPPSADFRRQLSRLRLPQCLLGLAGAHAAAYLLWILSWWMVGKAALEGRVDTGWLLAWALLLLTLFPFRLLAAWLQGVLALGAGGLLKQRLLHGALRLEPEEARRQGAGQLLGRVIESEAVESLALSGGFLGLVSLVELILAAAILAAGAGGGPHALLLAAWSALTFPLAARYYRLRQGWTASRLEMTHDLVERMVGHRTRLVQEAGAGGSDEESLALERYTEQSRRMDRMAVLLALAPRGWLVVGLAGLGHAFTSGGASSAGLAVGLGGVLLAHQALRRLAAGLAHLAGAGIAWDQVAGLFRAAARPELTALPLGRAAAAAGGTVLEARELVFRYRDRGEPVLQGADLRISRGDKILLLGDSGAGKSTLASLLVGLRRPESGLLLLRGLDRRALGARAWRRGVLAAPQFHENHVLTGTFAFNLLLGRRWPPRQEDLEEAERICRELGLGELLERMPAGLQQTVGETGWRLSHGERSRLYIARLLLQDAEVGVLDESFAALDPESLAQALGCVLRRLPALVVVAHP